LFGYAGKILFVNLSSGEIRQEELDEKTCHDFLGGYGIGARVLYSRQKGGVDALGPENILGLVTGPLTGTPAVTGARYTAVAKSPLTGGWGDANSGGDFGPLLRWSGFDAVFFSGASDHPVYLLIDDGRVEIKDAGHIWGKDTYATEEILREAHGKKAAVSCIGPSGEKMSLISGIITARGAAAGRSGLGAVMGSKKLKAVVATGSRAVPVHDREAANNVKKEHLLALKKPGPDGTSFFENSHKYGSAGHTDIAAHSGDSPVKNWGGIGVIDLPDVSGLSGDSFISHLLRHEACWQCSIACQAILTEGKGEYEYITGVRRPEYETAAAFGSNCLNSNTESINKLNDICNRNGLDTISAGSAIAFAMECYEHGLISLKDTDNIPLEWGNHRSMVAMTEKIARREGFGDILADGVKAAAAKIGRGSEKFAVHVGGQEPGMHDPKLPPPPFLGDDPSAARYQMDATPGRHTQSFGPAGYKGHLVNSLGVCMFGFFDLENPGKYIEGYIRSVTGWDYSWQELLKTGERIATLRHAFNLREGINPLDWTSHPRMLGRPPFTSGPLANVTADFEAQLFWNLGIMGWDRRTTKPSRERLLELGLEDVARDLYPGA
jgi:aldehyde:ferredoxin oxidoreductase